MLQFVCNRVDSFATYAYSCRICLLEFLIVSKLKAIKKIVMEGDGLLSG